MSERLASRRRPRRQIVCRPDGELFDRAGHVPLTVDDLREHLRAGGLFEATAESGRDATFEVLIRLIPPSPSGPTAPDPFPVRLALPDVAGVMTSVPSDDPGWSRVRRRRTEIAGWVLDPDSAIDEDA